MSCKYFVFRPSSNEPILGTRQVEYEYASRYIANVCVRFLWYVTDWLAQSLIGSAGGVATFFFLVKCIVKQNRVIEVGSGLIFSGLKNLLNKLGLIWTRALLHQ
jgi:hypothetical protein